MDPAGDTGFLGLQHTGQALASAAETAFKSNSVTETV